MPEAWIRVGEFYFDQGDLLKAREAYAQAMRTPDSKFYDKALYKLAWTYYRQDDFGGAIERFKAAQALPVAQRGADAMELAIVDSRRRDVEVLLRESVKEEADGKR